jgi:ABC-2 type transport system permease protein
MSALLKSELRKLIYLRANWLLLIWSGLFAALGTVAPILVLNSENGPGRGVFSGTETPEGINAVFANAAGGYLFALILGILIMTNEYRHGTAVGTFLVTPKHRLSCKVDCGKPCWSGDSAILIHFCNNFRIYRTNLL